MFEKSGIARHKNEARVIVTMAGQAPFEASVFLKIDERLIDLLNDGRMFIPIKRADGETLIASKQNIVSIIERRADEEAKHAQPPPPVEEPAQAPAEDPKPAEPEPESADAAAEPEEPAPRPPPRRKRNFDPYEVLRVPREASLEDIRRAWKARMKAVHPDAIAALDLDEDLSRAAHLSAQRVNRAYQVLLREKQQEARAAEVEAEAEAEDAA